MGDICRATKVRKTGGGIWELQIATCLYLIEGTSCAMKSWKGIANTVDKYGSQI